MSLFTKSVPEDVEARQLREARVKAARACIMWEEISPPERLIAKGPKRYGWMVDAETDQIYVLHAGTAFLPRSAAVVAERMRLAFTVDSDGDVQVFECLRRPATWSDVISRSPELAAK